MIYGRLILLRSLPQLIRKTQQGNLTHWYDVVFDMIRIPAWNQNWI